MANLTLVIDDELLRRARVKAAAEGRSVNAVARQAIEAFAGEDEAQRAWAAFLEAARGSSYTSGPAGRTWTRGEIYSTAPGRHGG